MLTLRCSNSAAKRSEGRCGGQWHATARESATRSCARQVVNVRSAPLSQRKSNYSCLLQDEVERKRGLSSFAQLATRTCKLDRTRLTRNTCSSNGGNHPLLSSTLQSRPRNCMCLATSPKPQYDALGLGRTQATYCLLYSSVQLTILTFLTEPYADYYALL